MRDAVFVAMLYRLSLLMWINPPGTVRKPDRTTLNIGYARMLLWLAPLKIHSPVHLRRIM